jgi:hypothetical protein
MELSSSRILTGVLNPASFTSTMFSPPTMLISSVNKPALYIDFELPKHSFLNPA